MDALQVWAGQAEWATKNLAHNLDFIPDDKLDWKPAPEANSALEVAQHLIGSLTNITAVLRAANAGQSAPESAEIAKPATRDEAKQQLIAAAQGYVELTQTVKAEDLQKMVESPMGKMPMWFMMGLPPTEAIHHHGQIAYIQELLGDAESHFDMSLMPK